MILALSTRRFAYMIGTLPQETSTLDHDPRLHFVARLTCISITGPHKTYAVVGRCRKPSVHRRRAQAAKRDGNLVTARSQGSIRILITLRKYSTWRNRKVQMSAPLVQKKQETIAVSHLAELVSGV